MRVATWNVNGLRARLEFVRAWLRERRPDVVGLQELKAADEQFPHEEFEREGYRAAAHGQKGWNGVAILAREEPVVVQRGLPGQEERGARLLAARIGDLLFTSIYCPNGKQVGHDDFRRKLAWLDTLIDYLRRHHDPAAPVLLSGDFNICPTGLDSWDEEGLRGSIFHTDEERERFSRLIDLGFHDIFREMHPDERAFSWWDYRGGAFHRGQGLRIDFLLASPALRDRVRSVIIDRDYRKKKDGMTPSDHAPVIAEID